MSFATVYNEVARLRFTGQTVGPKAWVQAAEAWCWSQADWPWKRVPPTAVAITSGQDFITAGNLPTDFRRVTDLYDDLGDALAWLDEETFNAVHLASPTASGRPERFTVVNGLVSLDPKPNAAYSFKISYRRTLVHLSSGGGVVVGCMTSDTDLPIFPADFHYMLVHKALSIGKRTEKDSSFADDDALAQDLLGAMMAEHLPDRPISARLQYGRDQL